MSIAHHIAQVQERIATACRRAGRTEGSVQLMAVSKTHPAEAILEAHAAGIRLFGENRVQEYAGKRAQLAETGMFSGPAPPRMHCIGPVQSNKAMKAAEIFDAIDSVDSLRLAERLEAAAERAGKQLPILVEIKLSLEKSKHGLEPGCAELAELLERLPDLPHLDPGGLMTVPPYTDDPEGSRPYFRRLRELRESLAQRHPRLKMDGLSMGMSHDFEVAIEEGATMVRVGTAIFGARALAPS
jgi:pyridoxal phosphate enzyme (YggS family)